MLKYALPVATAFTGAVIPHLFFYFSRKQLGSKSKEKMEEDLLQLLVSFSHGEWALRSLNSLQLFFKNYSKENLSSEKYLTQLMSRIDTFWELTSVNIDRIIKLNEKLKLDAVRNEEMKASFDRVLSFLKRIKDKNALRNMEDYKFIDCSNEFDKIKSLIVDLRTAVYSGFSCDIYEVLDKFIELYENDLTQKRIKLNVTRKSDIRTVLIRPHEFIDALDNLITNAVRAVEGCKTKEISIVIKSVTPKVHIDFADTGHGIKKESWKEIFERGFSTGGSTGEGLYQAKSMIEKYGGRIYVKSSTPSQGTVFTIEINKGIKA